ncbi:MAG: hypothetical protein ACE5IG_02815 [Dehalococcoidia bacterium]
MKKRRVNLLRVLVLAAGLTLPILIGLAIHNTRANTQEVELRNVQSAVLTMMADNGISALPHPVTVSTNDMSAFPDVLTSPREKGLLDGDKPGYVLYGHDKIPDQDPETLYYYLSFETTRWFYTVTSDGTVLQSSGPE